MTPLERVSSIKVKLGLLVAASALVAAVVASVGRITGVSPWISIPVTIGIALAVTQLLAAGMTSPLRQMTVAARRMARGDYSVSVPAVGADEVGQLGRAFNTMASDLGAVDRQRRDLVANVSHELRTPLAALTVVLENLVDGVGSDPAALQTALGQAERLSRLVEDLLDLARVDAGKAPLSTASVELGPLLEACVAETRTNGRPVTYEFDAPADLVVDADPDRLSQLVVNLLDNASRHSPRGGVVTVRAGIDGERYHLEVIDSGPGIPIADRGRVFEPFGTLSASGEGGGTGLGLAIARWVTDLHGGSIAFLDPLPGAAGARVRVDLPLRPPARAVPDQLSPSHLTPTHEESQMPTTPPAAEPAEPANPVETPSTDPKAAYATLSVLDDIFGTYWPDSGVAGRFGLFIGAVVAGLLGGLLIPDRNAGLGTVIVLLAAGGVVMLASENRRSWFPIVCYVLFALLSSVAVFRDAEWLVVLCLLTAIAVILCASTQAKTLLGIVLSGISWPLAGLRGIPWLGRTLTSVSGKGHGAAVARTTVLSLLGLVIFGLLFTTADAVLGSWVDQFVPDVRPDTFAARIFMTVFVFGLVLAAAYLAVNPPRIDRSERTSQPVANRYEWLAPVGVVVAVFAAFLIAQATAVFGGEDYLRETTGLTYAEYVHQGFGQLTVATALTLLVIWAAARKAPVETVADRLWLRIALGLLAAEALVVVGSALYRMHLYQEAYGFTQLRLLVDVFEAWLGLLVIAGLVAAVTGKAIGGGLWLGRFALVSGAVALLGIAAINPDAWIAEHNVSRYEETGKIDTDFLSELSDDAVPALTMLPDDLRSCVLGTNDREGDWLEWNLGRERADGLTPVYAATVDTTALCPSETRYVD
jgi:signal transduction histidine kinase